LIRKASHTHRYLLTEQGRLIITAILAAQNASNKQLAALARDDFDRTVTCSDERRRRQGRAAWWCALLSKLR